MEKGFARASLWSKIQLRSSVRKRSWTSSRDWLLIRHRYVVIPKNQSHQRAEVEGETQQPGHQVSQLRSTLLPSSFPGGFGRADCPSLVQSSSKLWAKALMKLALVTLSWKAVESSRKFQLGSLTSLKIFKTWYETRSSPGIPVVQGPLWHPTRKPCSMVSGLEQNT